MLILHTVLRRCATGYAPRMPDPALLVFALVVVAVSATLQGTTGFGYNILVVPLLALFIDPKTVIPAVILHNIVIDLAVLVTAWRFVNLRRIWLLLLAGLIGTPIGVLIQGIIDPDPLRLLIGAAVAFTGLIMLAGYKRPIGNEYVASMFAGSIGGTMNGVIGMAGPPVILLFANQSMPPREFRANIVTYFTLITIIAIASFGIEGALTDDVFELALATVPATTAGVILGIRLHGRVPLDLFYKASLVLVVAAGVTILIAGLLAL